MPEMTREDRKAVEDGFRRGRGGEGTDIVGLIGEFLRWYGEKMEPAASFIRDAFTPDPEVPPPPEPPMVTGEPLGYGPAAPAPPGKPKSIKEAVERYGTLPQKKGVDTGYQR